jgi:hypothetical protein
VEGNLSHGWCSEHGIYPAQRVGVRVDEALDPGQIITSYPQIVTRTDDTMNATVRRSQRRRIVDSLILNHTHLASLVCCPPPVVTCSWRQSFVSRAVSSLRTRSATSCVRARAAGRRRQTRVSGWPCARHGARHPSTASY